METINVFFYKLSRKFIAFWDLLVAYFNGSTRDEKILLIVLVFLVLLFFIMVFIIILRINFNRRIKKLGFANVMHINVANEVYDKNIFVRFFLAFWNFKKLVAVEIKPLSSRNLSDEEEKEIIEEPSDTVVEEVIEELPEEVIETVPEPVVEDIPPVLLSREVEELIARKVLEQTRRIEIQLNNKLSQLIKEAQVVEQPLEETPIIEETEVIEELPEVVEEVIEKDIPQEIEEKEPTVTPVVKKEYDPFFDEEPVKKYIVSKHPISGWQIKKEGSKRATRLFNSKKQAVAFATKSKFEFEIQ